MAEPIVLIYKISSELTDLIYVGSTTQKLNDRLSSHRYDYKMFLDEKFHYVTSFKIFELDSDCRIALIEKCNEDVRDERERYWVDNTPDCVNKYLPGRTNAQYYQDNKVAINKKRKVKCVCLCGGRYTHQNKAIHDKTKIHQKFVNRLE